MAGEWADRWNADRILTEIEAALPEVPAGLDRLLRAASPRVLVLLEARYRARRHTVVPPAGPFEASLAALLTFDRSGHLREAGTRSLAAGGGAFALPFLLLRLNDPVEVVREVAFAAVGRSAPVDLAPLLPLIDTLARRSRSAPLLNDEEG